MTAPRIYGIVASEAPVAADIRRGPSDWCHVGRWDLASGAYEPGAWFRGVIYPQECDLSPDGRWFVYSAMKVGSDWPAGEIYEAISRLPWLTALAAWNSGTTYTRGLHFVNDPKDSNAGAPDIGELDPCLRRYGLRWTLPQQFAVERRHGWVESADSPPRREGDWWDERRRVVVEKRQPGGGGLLRLEGRYAAFRAGEPGDGAPLYRLDQGDEIEILEDVQWAEWDQRGRLLTATSDGRLRICSSGDGSRVTVADLADLEPDPRPPPDWAVEW